MLRRPLHLLSAGLFFLALVVALQWASGAYRAEFAGEPDESAHYVTGLMVREYAVSLAPAPPLQFAENYYLHYPKVGIGHWPPFFYVVQAAWTLLFSPGRASVLLLMALVTVLFALTLYRVVESEFSTWAGLASAVLLISLPLVQKHSGMVMSDVLTALLGYWAALSFGRYVDSQRRRDALAFGLFATLAILTKATGLALVLVPPLALLFARCLHLLRRPLTWLPAAVVVVLCAPWYLAAQRVVPERVALWAGIGPGGLSLWQQLVQASLLTGVGPCLVILIGLAVRTARLVSEEDGNRGRWAASVALLLAVLVFRFRVGAAQDFRHMLAVAPVMVMFLAAGVAWLGPRLPLGRLSPRRKTIVLAGVLAAVFALETFSIPPKNSSGVADVARDLISRPELKDSVILVSSEGTAEGEFIAEVAMREPRPTRYLLRATKTLARVGWGGFVHRAKFQSADELTSYLESIPAGVLVLDVSPSRFHYRHHRLLQEMVKAHPERWQPLVSRNNIRVYRLAGQEGRSVGKIRIDMRNRLRKVLEN